MSASKLQSITQGRRFFTPYVLHMMLMVRVDVQQHRRQHDQQDDWDTQRVRHEIVINGRND